MLISSVMTPCPYKISSDKSLEEALKIMDLRNIRHLPVIEGEDVIGVVSKRDIEIGKLISEKGGVPKVKDICVNQPYVVGDDTKVSEVVSEMSAKKIDCALVVDADGNFTGIFTVTDVCKLLAMILEEQEK